MGRSRPAHIDFAGEAGRNPSGPNDCRNGPGERIVLIARRSELTRASFKAPADRPDRAPASPRHSTAPASIRVARASSGAPGAGKALRCAQSPSSSQMRSWGAAVFPSHPGRKRPAIVVGALKCGQKNIGLGRFCLSNCFPCASQRGNRQFLRKLVVPQVLDFTWGTMVPRQGFEPWTSALPRMRSTTELSRRMRGGGYSQRRGPREAPIRGDRVDGGRVGGAPLRDVEGGSSPEGRARPARGKAGAGAAGEPAAAQGRPGEDAVPRRRRERAEEALSRALRGARSQARKPSRRIISQALETRPA